MPLKDLCKECIFWKRVITHFEHGICQRNAPIAGIGFPSVEESDGCGQFRYKFSPEFLNPEEV